MFRLCAGTSEMFLLNNLNIASTIIWIILLINMIVKARYEDELLLIRHPEARTDPRSEPQANH